MAKNKKKTLGIKTTRYFTKTCSNCKLEYPNWFTNCPKCGAAWDESEAEEIEESGELKKKTIKIVVKITEEDFDNKLEQVKLVFSADHGKSWYQMKMENQLDYFIAEIAEVPIGSLVIYYIEVSLINGEKVIENNDGNYYLYNVGMTEKMLQRTSTFKEERLESGKEAKEYDSSDEMRVEAHPPLIKESIGLNDSITPHKADNLKVISPIANLDKEKKISRDSFILPPIKPIDYKVEKNLTIFGTPQTQIDPDLRICPHCNSKIKKMWSTCPICGKSI
ncbi:MAG: hypothetical protein ACFFEO_04830 [Candidatus Thorarchaeota archaeon]